MDALVRGVQQDVEEPAADTARGDLVKLRADGDLHADIEELCDDTLLEALIVKQFRDRQVMLDSGVVAYLAPRISRDAAGIRDLVERLDHASLSEGRKITIALARKILENPVD